MASPTNGRLDLEALERLVAEGQVDTVLSAIPDMQGRLMGKRLTARFFLEHVAREGTHACSYLLGTDVEMNTLPGFALTGWRTGYHDFKVRPDMFTGDAYETDPRQPVARVPGALYEAIPLLENSALAREAFGEHVIAHYLNAARNERAAYDRAVTNWERDRYFERI